MLFLQFLAFFHCCFDANSEEATTIMETKAIKLRARRRSYASWGLAILGLAVLGGCSAIPDALNPAEWYKDTVDLFSVDKQADEASKGEQNTGLVADKNAPPPGAGKAFPNLASVPERPQPTPADQRQSAVEGLVADSGQRSYSSESIARQGEPASTLATMPEAPPAVPSFPVAQAPVVPAPVEQAQVAPPKFSMPPPMPSTTALPRGVEEAFRAGLSQGLPQGGGSAPPARLPANAQAAIVGETFSTVVISSSGVELLDSGAASPAPALAVPPVRSALSVTMAPAASLPRGAQMVATIQFSNGSSRLTARDKRILRDVSALHRQGGAKVTVVGHSSQRTRDMDADRHNQVNQKLSKDRADAVFRELLRLGVAAGSIQVSAVSDSRPLYYEYMPTGEAGNRRTEIYLGG